MNECTRPESDQAVLGFDTQPCTHTDIKGKHTQANTQIKSQHLYMPRNVLSMSLMCNMTSISFVCTCECEKNKLTARVTWSMTVMEYLGLRPFTAESPGNAKVHQGVIYSSVTAGSVCEERFVCMVTHICGPIQHVWTYFYACVLLCDAVGRVCSVLIPADTSGSPIDQQNVSS